MIRPVRPADRLCVVGIVPTFSPASHGLHAGHLPVYRIALRIGSRETAAWGTGGDVDQSRELESVYSRPGGIGRLWATCCDPTSWVSSGREAATVGVVVTVRELCPPHVCSPLRAGSVLACIRLSGVWVARAGTKAPGLYQR